MYERRAEQKSQGKIIVKIIWTPVSNLKKREREKEETGLNNLQRCRITSSFYDTSGVGRAFPGGHWWMLQLESVLEEHLFSFSAISHLIVVCMTVSTSSEVRVGYTIRLCSWPFNWSVRHWKWKWQPYPVLLPGESYEQRSRAGCSPWVTESDVTERL